MIAYNPLVRVPTLVLDGAVLIESHCILDYLDDLVGARRALFPTTGVARRDAFKVAALATGLGDKAVSLFYERRLHEQVSAAWVERCRAQIQGVARALEADRGQKTGTYWFGERLGHVGSAVAAVLRFAGEANPGLLAMAEFPAPAAPAAPGGLVGVSNHRTAVYSAGLRRQAHCTGRRAALLCPQRSCCSRLCREARDE